MGTVVALAPGVHNVHVHEGSAVASLHHLVADLLQQHQGQQASHHQGLQRENVSSTQSRHMFAILQMKLAPCGSRPEMLQLPLLTLRVL